MGWLEKGLLPALKPLSYLHRAYIMHEPHLCSFYISQVGSSFQRTPFSVECYSVLSRLLLL